MDTDQRGNHLMQRIPGMHAGTALLAVASMVIMLLQWGSGPGQADEGESSNLFDMARQSGQPVEIEQARTEHDTVFANPDGTYTYEINAVPIRVATAAGWQPVDLDLELDGGGLRPKASTQDLLISAGGEGPLISYGVDSVRVELAWVDELPEPTLQGNSATFAEVLPDVDLVVTLSEAGPSTVLVVKSAAAAANPELQQVEFGLEVVGGSVTEEGDGALAFRDAADRPVAFSGQPLMWDSSGRILDSLGDMMPATEQETIDVRVEGPAEGDLVSHVGLEVEGEVLVLEPSTSALTGPDVEYPVYIDPEMTRNPHSWAMVYKQYPNTEFWHWSDASQGVGYQTGYGAGTSTKRLYWKFNIPSGVHGSHVYSAEFSADMVHSASCTKTVTRLYRVGDMDLTNRPTWNSQPAWTKLQSEVNEAHGRTGCTPGGKRIEWNATEAVTFAAANSRGWLNLGLRVANESDPLSWKRFEKDARLTLKFSHPPRKPTGLQATPSINCSLPVAQRVMGYEQPRLQAQLSDPNAGDKLQAIFEIYRGSTITASAAIHPVNGYRTAFKAPTSTYVSPFIPLDPVQVVDGVKQSQTYVWRIRAKDNSNNGTTSGLVGPWSDPCVFTVDPEAPLSPHLLGIDADTEWDYPSAGHSVTFAPAPDDPAPDTTYYRWRFNNDEPPTSGNVLVDSQHRATVTVAAPQLGVNRLYVWAYDAAGNRSPAAVYRFEAFGDAEVTTYGMNEGTGAIGVFDQDGSRAVLGISGQWDYRGVYYDDLGNAFADPALTFDGAQGRVGSSRVIDPSRSFTVAAWLDPAQPGAAYGVSHDDGARSFFRLGVETTCHNEDGPPPALCFAFAVWDPTTSAYVTATTASEVNLVPAEGETWVHVVGQFDALTGQVTVVLSDSFGGAVYQASTQVVGAHSLTSSDRLVLGAARVGGVLTQSWTGGVDHLTLVNGIFTQDDILTLHQDTGGRTSCDGVTC